MQIDTVMALQHNKSLYLEILKHSTCNLCYSLFLSFLVHYSYLHTSICCNCTAALSAVLALFTAACSFCFVFLLKESTFSQV